MTTLATLFSVSRSLSATPKRKEKTEKLAAFLRALGPEEVSAGVAYLSGETLHGNIGVGPALLRKMSTDVPPAVSPSLGVLDVAAALAEIASLSGRGSTEVRTRLLAQLFARATQEEHGLLFGLLTGELRQGAQEGVMIEAVALASGVASEAVRQAHATGAALSEIALALQQEGAAGLHRFALRLLKPVRPMLAQTAGSIEEAFEALGPMALEWKMDGARVQLHKLGGDIRVFSRALNDVTAAVPELVELAARLPARALLLDGEAIALHPDGRPRPFQETMRRFGRRSGVEALRSALPLSVFFFDCLHLDGQDLVALPEADRWTALTSSTPETTHMRRTTVGTLNEAQDFLEHALAVGHEGVMAKSLASPYEAGGRGAAWLKVKRAHTLDLVVLAAEWGSGRRKGWLSNLHLGARDASTGSFVMLGKTFKGLTDVLLNWQTEQLLARETTRDDHTVYVRPELVVEIAFDGVQTSPQYPGGVALRFARVKGYRADKRPEETNTLDDVKHWLP